MTESPKSEDEKQRDEILRRMLKTPPKPHKPSDRKDAEQEGEKVPATKPAADT